MEQGTQELGKQKQEVEGLGHLQACSDTPAPRGCAGWNNAALCGMAVPPRAGPQEDVTSTLASMMPEDSSELLWGARG